MFNTQYAHNTQSHSVPFQSGYYPAVQYSAPAHSYPQQQPYVASHHQVHTPVPPAPQSSCLKAIQMGFQVYAALAPEARQELHMRGRKPASFRRIATDRGIPVSTLWRAVAIYLLYRRYPELGSYVHLGVAHLSVILGVSPEQQLYFLRAAEAGRWSRRRLDREVKRWQGYVRQHSQVAAATPTQGQPPSYR